MVPTPRRALRLYKLSWDTSCEADNNGRTLEELMLNLASITGNLIGGDTLAGGSAAEAGYRVLGLPLRLKLRATVARRDCVVEDIRRETKHAPVSFTVVPCQSSLYVVSSPPAAMRGA